MDNKALAEEIRKMPDEELAAFRADKLDSSIYAILADKEFERRERLQQHQLDRRLIAEQVQWMKFTAILGVVGTIAGTIIGVFLTYLLQDKPSPKQSEPPPRSSQQESAPSASVDRTEKAESVPSKSP
jgi:hypothetical protein